jgi:hypothetical protein
MTQSRVAGMRIHVRSTSRRANFGSAPPSRVRWFHTSECDLSPRAYRYEVDDVVAQPTLGPLVSDSVIANTRGVHVWERIWRLGMSHAHRHDAQTYPPGVSIRQSIVFREMWIYRQYSQNDICSGEQLSQ